MEKKKSFVKLERGLIRSLQYRGMGSAARDLYVLMADSLFDNELGVINKSLGHVSFGPSDAVKWGMSRATYYRAEQRLIDACVVAQVEQGGHGKRSVYDLTVWRWKNGD